MKTRTRLLGLFSLSSITAVLLALAVCGAGRAAAQAPLTQGEVIVVLPDGVVVRGKVDLKTFDVQTAYGALTVPVTEVQQIRIGKKANRELKTRIDKLIRDLGDKDFPTREAAVKELGKLGKRSYAEIEAASRSSDPEVATRASSLLADITVDDEEDMQPVDDEVVTRQFVIRGDVKLDALNLTTPFGQLKIEKKDLASMTFGGREVATKNVNVTGQQNSNQWLDTGLRVKKGDRLVIKATGNINWANYGYNTDPRGSSNWGTWRSSGNQRFLYGALIGKIGNGSFFLVGDKYSDRIPADGTLYLSIAIDPAGVQTDGQYKVSIEVRPASEIGSR